MAKQKNVQIPTELFEYLRAYFILNDHSHKEEIRKLIENKCEALLNHQIYSLSKTQPDEEGREAARNWYLDRKGFHKDFRY